MAIGHTTQLPVYTNRFDLDPDLKDAWGVPVLRLTFADHENDVAMMKWFGAKGKELVLPSTLGYTGEQARVGRHRISSRNADLSACSKVASLVADSVISTDFSAAGR